MLVTNHVVCVLFVRFPKLSLGRVTTVPAFRSILQSPEHWLDVGVLLLLQAVNGSMGWWEERKAGNAIAALKSQLALLANVKRDGAWISLGARELVEGDVLHLKLGDLVPADCELLPNLGGLPIQVDQSALNGESLPKTMRSGDTVLQGSVVKRGEIDAVWGGARDDSVFFRLWTRDSQRSIVGGHT